MISILLKRENLGTNMGTGRINREMEMDHSQAMKMQDYQPTLL